MTVKLFSKITHVIRIIWPHVLLHIQGFPLVSLITTINIRITPLIDSSQDGVRVRRYNFHFWNRSCLQFWDDLEMNDKCQTDGRGRHNAITMWITQLPEIVKVVKIRSFPPTYL